MFAIIGLLAFVLIMRFSTIEYICSSAHPRLFGLHLGCQDCCGVNQICLLVVNGNAWPYLGSERKCQLSAKDSFRYDSLMILMNDLRGMISQTDWTFLGRPLVGSMEGAIVGSFSHGNHDTAK